MAQLLIDEYPLMVSPSLAVKFGLNEAHILQQMHYWLQKSNYEHDGRKWIYNSYTEWQKQFPFWSTKTIQRIMLGLEKKNIIVSGNYNKMKMDRTKWYSINYEQLGMAMRTTCPHKEGSLPLPIPETTTETNNNLICTLFDYWNSKGIIIHRKLTDTQRRHINAKLKDYTADEIREAIDNYATILNNDEYTLTHRWKLEEFLTRGFEKLKTESNPFESYRRFGTTYKPKQNVSSKLKEIDSL